MLSASIGELMEMQQSANIMRLIQDLRQQLPKKLGGTAAHAASERSQPTIGEAHMQVFASPQTIVLDVTGWEQQTRPQPWRPVCPSFVADVGKHSKRTLYWIIRNDAKYVKWVLTHAEKLQEPAMVMMINYFREHYQPSDPDHLLKRRKGG
jgi:hypothetical protein